METEVFKAVCPLEIGDTVAIGAGKTAAKGIDEYLSNK